VEAEPYIGEMSPLDIQHKWFDTRGLIVMIQQRSYLTRTRLTKRSRHPHVPKVLRHSGGVRAFHSLYYVYLPRLCYCHVNRTNVQTLWEVPLGSNFIRTERSTAVQFRFKGFSRAEPIGWAWFRSALYASNSCFCVAIWWTIGHAVPI
jgi:hypothetical protein